VSDRTLSLVERLQARRAAITAGDPTGNAQAVQTGNAQVNAQQVQAATSANPADPNGVLTRGGPNLSRAERREKIRLLQEQIDALN
jgi:hypothetical protein